tara:strand:- start:3622 stop:3813 length:192 start_codon:yes stop_codon:yes gene_type:complete
MDWGNIIDQMGGGLSAVVIAALAFTVYRKDNQLAAKDERYIDLALSTQKALSDMAAAIREKRP